MHQKFLNIALSALLLLAIPLKSYSLDISISGFGTLAASKSNIQKSSLINVPTYASLPRQLPLATNSPYVSPTYYRPTYVGAERRWNMLPNSKFALQFTSIFDDKFRAVAQLIGRWETMTYEHYTAKMDWAYAQYNVNQLDVIFGRFRIPSFYYSDYLDVNNAQPWVMAPDEVYFIVGGAFRNMDGIKARYMSYIKDWTLTSQVYYGTMEENLFILFNDIHVKVRDVVGVTGQFENDFMTLRGSIMRSIYDTNLYGNLHGLVSVADQIGVSGASRNVVAKTQDKNQSIIYIGLAAAFNLTDDLNLLFERASIMSPGIISTARVGWYSSLTYSMNKFAYTATYGFSRPLQTEVNKYNAVVDFVNTSQYQALDGTPTSGAGAAYAEPMRSYLGKQRSFALDVRYDILPSLALKGGIKYVQPIGDRRVKYVLNRLPTYKHIWVYRLSCDFVF